VTSVIDASAVVDLLLRTDRGERVRGVLGGAPVEPLVTVGHLDAEVFSALARLHRAGSLRSEEIEELLRRLARLDVLRLPIAEELLRTAWTFRDNIAARDALYVALARGIRAPLITTDARLSRAAEDVAVIQW
jgi:predicted nucleic acid-binding protein